MQTATYHAMTLPSTSTPGQQQHIHAHAGPIDPVKASVKHLLSRAYTLPCSTAAQAFMQLVQPTSRFQLALDALLPLLDPITPAELAQRILVSYILYSLYAPHPISINPFKSVLYFTFLKERDQAIQMSSGNLASGNEQLVWVLWKILKGDGNDIGPYSPSTLARSPLPPKLRANNLVLDDESYYNNTDDNDTNALYTSVPKHQHSNIDVSNNDKRRSPSFSDEASEPLPNPAQEAENEKLTQGMQLLLDARSRILTLSEQRILTPMISVLTNPPNCILTSLDLSPILTHNPSLAHPLFVGLLAGDSSSPTSPASTPTAQRQALPLTVLDILTHLPPTLTSFDLFGRLLQDATPMPALTIPFANSPTYSSDSNSIGEDDAAARATTTVADLVRTEVLGRFVHSCISWLEQAEREEKEGEISDDRVAKGVRNLCRFYASLIKLSLVDPSSDADSAEMAHFSLRNARYEEANALYRVFATGKF